MLSPCLLGKDTSHMTLYMYTVPSNSYAPLSVPKSGLSHFPRCKTRRGGVARPCTLFTSRLHTRPHSVTIRFASGSLAIGRTVASATATASDPPQAAIAAALLWELNALPFDHDTTTRLPKERLPTHVPLFTQSRNRATQTQADPQTRLHSPARDRPIAMSFTELAQSAKRKHDQIKCAV